MHLVAVKSLTVSQKKVRLDYEILDVINDFKDRRTDRKTTLVVVDDYFEKKKKIQQNTVGGI